MAAPSLPETMKAYLLEAYEKPYTLTQIPVPSISDPNDMLVRVDAASYCHTDAVLAAGLMRPYPGFFPFIGCHEFAGTVVALSPVKEASKNHRFKIGDQVAISGRGYHVCGKCTECTHPSRNHSVDEKGYSVYCPRSTGLGVSAQGGFAEYALVDERQVELIPAGMTAVEAAPLMCAGLTVYAAIKECRLEAGQRLGIMGCGGGLGHLGLQFATKMGLQVLGVDVAPEGLKLAQELETGAAIVDASQERAEDVRRRIGKIDHEADVQTMGLDAVIVLPESQRSFDYAMSLLKDGGLLVMVSFPRDGFHLSAFDVVFRRIRIAGSLIGTNRCLREMLDFCVEHGVRAKKQTYAFGDLQRLIRDYHKGVGGKLVVDFAKTAEK